MTLIKDLIEIPDHVEKGQFVLRLAEGVNRPEETLHDYVVTPELKGCYEDALSFIKSGLQSKTSKASYLHGSFGSGKSHFMAVLHLILQGNTAARGIPELAPVITKHNDWITGKKFLLVPYHMIGSHDMESGILGGYVDFIRRVHPSAPIPGVYLAEGLFRDAENLRKQMGDDRFFGTLGGDSPVDSEFGDVDRAWDAERFETATVAPPGSEERSQLISTLIGKFFGSYDTQAGAHGEAFLSVRRHARRAWLLEWGLRSQLHRGAEIKADFAVLAAVQAFGLRARLHREADQPVDHLHQDQAHAEREAHGYQRGDRLDAHLGGVPGEQAVRA